MNLATTLQVNNRKIVEFLRQLESCTHVTGIVDGQWNLHLHVKGALTFCGHRDDAVRGDYDAAVAASRNVFSLVFHCHDKNCWATKKKW